MPTRWISLLLFSDLSSPDRLDDAVPAGYGRRLGEEQSRTTPDHVLAQVRFGAGTALAVEVAGGQPPETTTFRMEIDGERGEIRISGGAARGLQSGKLTVSLRGELQPLDEKEAGAMPAEAAKVICMYAALRDDILTGQWTVPDFEHAVRLARLIEDVTASSETG